jgi:pyruvate dehydrogenase E1 component alpha subunit
LCNTYRYRGHHVGDVNRDYRTKQEEQSWISERDPTKLLSDWITDQKLADIAQLEAIRSQVKSEIDAAVEFAIKAEYPGADQVQEDVYA